MRVGRRTGCKEASEEPREKTDLGFHQDEALLGPGKHESPNILTNVLKEAYEIGHFLRRNWAVLLGSVLLNKT